VKELQKLLNDTSFSGFPIVEDLKDRILVGYIGRTELQYAINRAKKQGMLSPNAACSFAAQVADDAETPSFPAVTFDSMSLQTVDFSTYIDATPITVHPRLPLETAMELFKKMGPRVILVEHHGRLEGLVTVKDCLKYQFKAEALEHPTGPRDDGNGQHERLWEAFQTLGNWFADGLNNLSRGRLKLSPRSANEWTRIPEQTRSEPADDYQNEHEILDGTEDVVDDQPEDVEMDVR
jgi:chloride channel 3/4/5